jgi:diguanylate cyclase (GGDEF)-like protein
MPAKPPASRQVAALFGRHVAVALENLREEEAGRKRGELDAVRWVYDEQRLEDQLTREIQRAERHDRPLSILLLRVQNLDELRERYGRFLADRVLRQIAGALEDAMRNTDFLGAFKEDGFAGILVEADKIAAERAKTRLGAALVEIRLPQANLPDLQVDLACATATFPEGGTVAKEMIAAAEAKLSPWITQNGMAKAG